MEQKMKNFKEYLKFGEEGEHEVARVLIEMGVSVLPLYQFNNNHAPYLLTKNHKITLPDLACFKDGKSFFVEVKTKNQWISYKGRVETGIDKRLFNQYDKINEATGADVFLIFNQKIENEGMFICDMYKYTRFWDGKVNGKQVYPAMYFYNKEILKRINL